MVANRNTGRGPYLRKVRDVMAKEVVGVDPKNTLEEALAVAVDNQVAALPVINGRNQCVGMLSATDLLGLQCELLEEFEQFGRTPESLRSWLAERIARHGFEHRRVEEVMSSPPLTIGPDAPLTDAASAMLDHKVHRLVVVNMRNRLLGIISTTDILRAFVEGSALHPCQGPAAPEAAVDTAAACMA